MRAGELKRRIRIQQQSSTQDDYGQQIESWSDVLVCWAAIKAATSKEVYAASGFTSQITHKITIRFPRDIEIRSNMRILYGTRVFLIQAIPNPDEGIQQLALMCLELNEGK